MLVGPVGRRSGRWAHGGRLSWCLSRGCCGMDSRNLGWWQSSRRILLMWPSISGRHAWRSPTADFSATTQSLRSSQMSATRTSSMSIMRCSRSEMRASKWEPSCRQRWWWLYNSVVPCPPESLNSEPIQPQPRRRFRRHGIEALGPPPMASSPLIADDGHPHLEPPAWPGD